MQKKRKFERWTWARRGTALTFLAVLILGQFDWFPWVKGTTASTRLFDFFWLADPMAALEVTLAARRLDGSLLLAGGLLLIAYAALGRLFCGWVCPLGLLLDLFDGLRTRLRRSLTRRGLRLPEFSLPPRSKYWLLALVLLVSLAARLPAFQLISPINLLTRALVFASLPGLIVVGAILVLEFFSPRLWCRSLCPLGAFYSLIGRLGVLRVKIDHAREQSSKGGYCGLCSRRCPMGIDLLADHIRPGKPAVDDPECTRCGACVDGCPRASLSLGWVNPLAGRPVVKRAEKA